MSDTTKETIERLREAHRQALLAMDTQGTQAQRECVAAMPKLLGAVERLFELCEEPTPNNDDYFHGVETTRGEVVDIITDALAGMEAPRIPATPAQIEALQRGESVGLRLRMEPQPEQCRIASGHHMWRLQDEIGGWMYWGIEESLLERFPGYVFDCPVAVGDTVEVVCALIDEGCNEPGFGCTTSFCGDKFPVNSIHHTETADGHWWVLEVQNVK